MPLKSQRSANEESVPISQYGVAPMCFLLKFSYIVLIRVFSDTRAEKKKIFIFEKQNRVI